MKALIRFSVLLVAIASIWTTCLLGSFGGNTAFAEGLPATNFYTQDLSKIDLNNSNINTFRQVRGMYPTLGRIIIDNAPYQSLDDVLNIAGLTDGQKELIKANADKFTLKKPDESMGRERINNANYRL
ncbi:MULTISPECIES: photosystem II complex extrinsic protein PsbU [Pseudanabaena]|uniref:Photosystem II oxygen evolving complex protein PsbU n=2 Tax=Pseudanabaena TaxID=1152 RepID=L8MUZ3_9CYAN|nr:MULTISPECIES: photosystem II complex extrinsic protein PsbU [Pseudanabaena]ELS31296.1 photosystem II oxygen evolving complex protein PsbU [Pseudanabaena biceps PCC 7429]MDG3496441.1 photosystem II complex extrinsic protein PsbU [Pseudanabaena catenata USMAC16]